MRGAGIRERVPASLAFRVYKAGKTGGASIDLETARHWYAEGLRFQAPARSNAVIAAFATVPREAFLGPPPWRLLAGGRDHGPLETDDPRHLYHDILVAIDPVRDLNNGQPSLWAYLNARLGLKPGERLCHVGAGTGYYSAILAEIVGPDGHVEAVEFDAGLAERARTNLSGWRQVRVVSGDGRTHDPGERDAIIVNAGVTALEALWLDSLADGGRLLVPLTGQEGWGHFLLATRQGDRYGARFVSRTSIIHCASGRGAAQAERLVAAFRRPALLGSEAVKSLRRDSHDRGVGCWLHEDEYCLSTLPIDAPRR